MIDTGHETTALTFLERRTRSRPGEHDRWRDLALELIAVPKLIHGDYKTSYDWVELAKRYVDERPDEIAAAIIRAQNDPHAGNWYSAHSEADQVLCACAERSPEGVWRSLEPQLSSKIDAHLFWLSFPKGVVERIPSDLVIAWVEADPDTRAAIVAKLANMDFSSDDTLVSRIVGTYGDREDVAIAFFSEYVTGFWSGPASAHWEGLAIYINELVNRTKLPKLRRWAQDKAAQELRRMADQSRQREEEEDLRRR